MRGVCVLVAVCVGVLVLVGVWCSRLCLVLCFSSRSELLCVGVLVRVVGVCVCVRVAVCVRCFVFEMV